MKIKIRVNELINILIQKQELPILQKYNLDSTKVERLQNALQEGRWKLRIS